MLNDVSSKNVTTVANITRRDNVDTYILSGKARKYGDFFKWNCFQTTSSIIANIFKVDSRSPI
jgi:hypothetical protein